MMLTRKELAKRWRTTTRTIDRRCRMGLLAWIDLTRGKGKRPQIRFLLSDVEQYENRCRLHPVEKADESQAQQG